jgi:L-fuculose-phosphate aldolase
LSPYQQEKEAVVQACLRLADRGYLAGTGGNLALRVAGGAFAVTPSASDYYTMQPDDICILDLATLAVIEGALKPSVESGIHARTLRARPDCAASVHTHQPLASAIALLGLELPVAGAEARAALGAVVPLVPYGPSGTGLLASAYGRRLRPDANAYLLRNHGLVCCGATLEQAMANVEWVEREAAGYLQRHIQLGRQGGRGADTLRRQVLAELGAATH